MLDLFAAPDASDEKLDFPTLVAPAKQGWVSTMPNRPSQDMDALFELILEDVPAPESDESCLFRMLAATLERDPYLGRVMSGSVRPNMPVRDSRILERSRTTRVPAVRELEREALEEGCAGDIIAYSGLSVATIADPENRRSLL